MSKEQQQVSIVNGPVNIPSAFSEGEEAQLTIL
jgi:hypothetical protein